jgi:hypothetical protein
MSFAPSQRGGDQRAVSLKTPAGADDLPRRAASGSRSPAPARRVECDAWLLGLRHSAARSLEISRRVTRPNNPVSWRRAPLRASAYL